MAKYVKKYADWKRKIWFEIYAPSEIFNNAFLGETPAYESKQVIGRKVECNLALLVGDFRLQNAKVIFQIKEVKGNRCETELVEYDLYEAYVRRIVRRHTDRIDDSFVVKTRDGIEVRVKPLVITQFNTVRSRRKAIRKKYREIIENFAKERDYYVFMKSIIFNELQSIARKELHKIYPVDRVEIRRAIRITPIKEIVEAKEEAS